MTSAAVSTAADIRNSVPIVLHKVALIYASIEVDLACQPAMIEPVHNQVKPRDNHARNEGAALNEPFENPT